MTCSEYTVIELTGPDRPGLLSEISAVLTNNQCNVNAAEVWTHNLRVACVIYFTDLHSAGPVKSKAKLGRIKELLSVVMKGDNEDQVARIDFATEATHVERRLHQMMSDDRRSVGSYESGQTGRSPGRPIINIQNRNERGYSTITIQCKDRPKLLFDIVCTLTDMQYVIFHATINSPGPETYQVYILGCGCLIDVSVLHFCICTSLFLGYFGFIHLPCQACENTRIKFYCDPLWSTILIFSPMCAGLLHPPRKWLHS